jgi:hypothetical protein
MFRLLSYVILLRGSCVQRCEWNFVRRSLTEVTAFRSLKLEAACFFRNVEKHTQADSAFHNHCRHNHGYRQILFIYYVFLHDQCTLLIR